MLRDKRDINPVLLKFGLALALSYAGFLYYRARTRRTKPSTSERPSDHDDEVNLGKGRSQHKDDLHAVKAPINSCSYVSGLHILNMEETCNNKVFVDNSPVGLSSSCRIVEDEILLPEFEDFLKDLNFEGTIVGNALKKDAEISRSKRESPKSYMSQEKDDTEQEIRHLKEMIKMLQEKERSLEVQMIEYCGLRKQETAVMELQNRLKISNVEAKMFNLKIENLKSENRILESQVADHAKLVNELGAARAKVKLLKKKLRYAAEQSKEQIITLQEKVAKLQDQESEAPGRDRDIEIQLQKLKDLESTADELRKSNLRLKIDNSNLARRLDSTQILAQAVVENPEGDALKEESERLKQANERLEKEVEQLQSARFSDVEELVYLRWVNACLRYELRSYQVAAAGKTLAISKSLTHTSQKKAKQLIPDDANSEGERGMSVMDFDSDQWSSSQNSFHTDSGDGDDMSSVYNSSSTRNNTPIKGKFITKLKNLVRGGNHKRASSGGKSGSQKDSNSSHYSSSISTRNDAVVTPSSTSKTSSDFQRLTSIKEGYMNSADGINFNWGNSKIFRTISFDQFLDSLGMEKVELEKYAEALKDSGASDGDSAKLPLRRIATCSSF